MHFASLHGQDRTHEAQQIILLIYVDSPCICGYACAHTSAHRIAHTHPNERTKRIGERTKRASESSELNESDQSCYWMNWIALWIKLSQANQTIVYKSYWTKQTTTSDILQLQMMTLNHIGYALRKSDIANNQSRMSQPHQMNGQIITDWTSNIK